MKTIVAFATPLFNSAIHIIRVSGNDCFFILSKVCKNKINKESNTIQRNFIIDKNKIIDDVLLNVFVAPKSYTGEDSIEINCHGGVVVSKMILELLIRSGCHEAKPGEFSQRAMLNNKINYQQVEAINNLIHANNEISVSFAINGVIGKDSKIIEIFREKIFDIIGSVEVNIDYPEYDDVIDMSHNIIKERINLLKEELQNIMSNSIKLQPIFKGLKIAIIGKPNVGKSSLLNLLSNMEKAIVSEVEGTTRDVVESHILLNGVDIVLLDTAGIRNTKDNIEKLGIEKTFQAMEIADMIIYLKDGDGDFKIPEFINKEKIIEVYNKSDIKKWPNQINISVKNKEIDDLLNLIKNKIDNIDYKNINTLVLQSDRQINILKRIISNIEELITELNDKIPLDLSIQKLENILNDFDKILGKTMHYDKLDEMFTKFCIGK